MLISSFDSRPVPGRCLPKESTRSIELLAAATRRNRTRIQAGEPKPASPGDRILAEPGSRAELPENCRQKHEALHEAGGPEAAAGGPEAAAAGLKSVPTRQARTCLFQLGRENILRTCALQRRAIKGGGIREWTG